jgi:hypothetical protein
MNNVLFVALKIQNKTSVDYFQFTGRVTNEAGMDVTTYAESITVTNGKVISVNKKNYVQFGLDFSKRYVNWFVPNLDAIDLSRDVSGDIIECICRRWELVGSNLWFSLDGWSSFLAIDIGPATGSLTNA